MNSLYRAMGDEAGIERVVDAMYDRVLQDESLKPFFLQVDMAGQRAKFRSFLHTVTGGPVQRSGIELRAAHSRHVDSGLSHEHFEGFLHHLRNALSDASVPDETAAIVMEKVGQTRNDVLGL